MKLKMFLMITYYGGLPQRFMMNEEHQIRVYLSDVYDFIIIKDIVRRFNIKDLDLLNCWIYCYNTISKFFRDNLSNFFLNQDNREVSKITLYNYLEYMSKAMFINKVERCDIRGKRSLNGKYKYYLTDLGLGHIKNFVKRPQMGAYLENIIYNKLVFRGYDVYIGNLESVEVDFIATRFNEKYIFKLYIF